MAAVRALFWVLLGLSAYAYVGYPALLWLATRRRSRGPEAPDPERWPRVSVMLPAHNEERVLEARLRNLLGLDYPPDRLEIVVGLDGSTDGSAAIARRHAGQRVRLLEGEQRQGKTALLNRMVPLASGEVVVYTDANCLYRPDAVRHLVRPFTDPAVGSVIGELKYVNLDDPAVGGGEGLYWRFENAIKEWESRLGGTLVANGSIYALRREMFTPLPPAISDDSVNPLRVLAAGGRVLFERRAVAQEKAAESLEEEFRRKARMVTRQLGSHAYVRLFLWPLRPILAFRLVSHKLLRWLVPWLLAGGLLIALARPGDPWMRAFLALAGTGLLAGGAGYLALRRGAALPRLLRLWVYFCVVNAAAVRGLLDFLRGRQRAVWSASASTR